MADKALELRQVTRRFGERTAVDRLTLDVEPGTVLGLLGRNGAGKTTCLRMAVGLLHATEGEIRVLGLDPRRQGLELRRQVSLLSEESALYGWMTVDEILRFGAATHSGWDRELASRLTKSLELDGRQRVSELSRGSKAKVSLILAVAVRPRLLLLDDPTAGLDPLVRREVLEQLLEAVPAEGGTVVYASHLIHDVERIADRVTILDEGRAALDMPLDELKDQVQQVTAVFADVPPGLEGEPDLIDCQRTGRAWTVVARGSAEELKQRARGWGAERVSVDPLSLEDVLVACLRRSPGQEVRDA